MNEHRAVKDTYIKLFIAIVCASLYMLGGWGDFLDGAKWLRRFVAPSVFALGLFYFSKDWKCFISLPFLMIGSSLGYGNTSSLMNFFNKILGN